MNHKIVAIFFAVFCCTVNNALDNYTNQTFMFTRPICDSIGIRQASWNEIVYTKKKNGFTAQIYVVGDSSFDNQKQHNPSYFLFHHKNDLSVVAGTPSSPFTTTGTPVLTSPAAGQYTVPSLNRDILGQWIGITSDTNPRNFTLDPHQKQVSTIFEVSQDLRSYFKSSFFENWFITFNFPLTYVENNIGITGDPTILNILSSSTYPFARMNNENRSSFRATQAHLSLGTRYFSKHGIHVITSSGVVIPLVGQCCKDFIFEPIQGYNSHFALNAQAFFQFPVYKQFEDSESSVSFFLDLSNNFLVHAYQLRTYDIKHKPFSRYMKFLDTKTNSLVPASKVLTIWSRVEPFNIINLAAGFKFKYKNGLCEVGYELWAHPTERVIPDHKGEDFKHGRYNGNGYDGERHWQDNRYGIPFINETGVLATLDSVTGAVEPLPAGQLGQTASGSTINFVAAPDGTAALPVTVYLTRHDLDHFTAAAQSAITHRMFIDIGFTKTGASQDYIVNIGLFVEESQNNAALCALGGWIKAGLSF